MCYLVYRHIRCMYRFVYILYSSLYGQTIYSGVTVLAKRDILKYAPRSRERRVSCRRPFFVMQIRLIDRLVREGVQISYHYSH